MTKNYNQFILGAILGAVAYEVVKKRNPELVNEIKQNLKDLGNSFEAVYSEVKDIVQTAKTQSQTEVKKTTTKNKTKRKR